MFNKIRSIKKYRELGADVVVKRNHVGISDDYVCETELVLSLTSFPARINVIDRTIKTLLNQTVKPNRLILWLAKEQFPYGDNSLPDNLLNLKKNGLEIEWVDENLGSYKKLIPALKKYPDAIIITVDDDWYYHRDLVKIMVEEHKNNPDMIISNLITHPYMDSNGKIHSSDNLESYIGTAGFWNKILGYGGVLYPPHCLSKEVFSEFMDIAPTNDDIWFWAMAVLNDTKTKVPDRPVPMIAMTSPETQSSVSLSQYNEIHNTYIKDTETIFNKYPIIKTKLLKAK